MWTPSKRKFCPPKKKNQSPSNFLDPPSKKFGHPPRQNIFEQFHGNANGDPICFGREIQCLLYLFQRKKRKEKKSYKATKKFGKHIFFLSFFC